MKSLKIKGHIDEDGRPRVVIEVFGGRGKAKLDPIIDTGFDGEVCIPIRTAVQLGLELIGVTTVELADGTKKEELVFQGKARLNNLEQEVEILLTEGEDALIGLRLFERAKITIDFAHKTAEIFIFNERFLDSF